MFVTVLFTVCGSFPPLSHLGGTTHTHTHTHTQVRYLVTDVELSVHTVAAAAVTETGFVTNFEVYRGTSKATVIETQHATTENSVCSNRGLCNEEQGVCECMHGYTGESCSDIWCDDNKGPLGF